MGTDKNRTSEFKLGGVFRSDADSIVNQEVTRESPARLMPQPDILLPCNCHLRGGKEDLSHRDHRAHREKKKPASLYDVRG